MADSIKFSINGPFPEIHVYSIRIDEVIFRVISMEGEELVSKIIAGILENEEIMLGMIKGELENNIFPTEPILSEPTNVLFDFNIGRTYVFGARIMHGETYPSIHHHVSQFLIRDWSSTNSHLFTNPCVRLHPSVDLGGDISKSLL